LRAIKAIFDWAVMTGDMSANPIAPYVPTGKEIGRNARRQQSSKRRGWGEALERLFRTPHFVEPPRDPADALFWAPLIGAFQRMRLEEILQLRAEDLYQSTLSLTHARDSQGGLGVIHRGNQASVSMAAAIGLRGDFTGDDLRRLARDSRDAKQVRRLLALAAICDGGSRTEAARIGWVGLQIVRDWVMRFNAEGPDGLFDRKAQGKPPMLTPK
jgi:hypothetical protein